MQITSSAFTDGATIPRRHSREGDELSPPLTLDGVPGAARYVALIVDDPDAPAGTWVHWLLWNLPSDRTTLPEGLPPDGEVSMLGGARQGRNDFDEVGYAGPMPPRGRGPHRYRFTAYALTEALDLAPGAGRQELERAMAGRVLDQCRLTGSYERP